MYINHLAHISPAAWLHINLAGYYDFNECESEIDVEKIAAHLGVTF